MITYKLKINCQESKLYTSDMEFVSGDVGAYRLEFSFYDNGKQIDLSDKLFTVKGKRADGVILSDSGTISENKAVFIPKNAFYAVPGELILEIALTDSAKNYITTKIISVTVLEGLGETKEVAEQHVSAYVTLLAQLKNRLDNADRLLEESKFSYETQMEEIRAVLDDKVDKNEFSPLMHARMFRGKNLGSVVTKEQKVAIRDGSFKDIYLGDYWDIDGIIWRIVDMDYWYDTMQYPSGEYLNTHHLVIMPDTCVSEGYINDSMETRGGYLNSKMNTTKLLEVQAQLPIQLRDLLLTHSEYFTNEVYDGVPAGTALITTKVDLPSELMMYGTTFYTSKNNIQEPSTLSTYGRTQLALFNIAPRFITVKGWTWWLRDVSSSNRFASINHMGRPSANSPITLLGIRPVFCIHG